MIGRILAACAVGVPVVAVLLSPLLSQPSFNGPTPGCGSGGGCHSQQSGIVSAAATGGLQVEITLTGATGNVAGELVDSAGTVVAVNEITGSNPFTLTAPAIGHYTVNAGFKSPSRQWGTTQVDVGVTGIDGGISGPPASYRLEQNYPNPFNPSTTIGYELPSAAHVTLKIFDVGGREVATLVDRMEGPGRKEVRFDALGLATGTYLYRLQAGGYVETRHLVIMR